MRPNCNPAMARNAKNPEVEAVFASYRKPARARLLALRRLILETAAATEGVGALEETLKWGQPSYLTDETGSGSTIRIDRDKSDDNRYAMFFNCQTDLVATFREIYPDQLSFVGNRSIVFDVDKPFPERAVRHCVSLALTYHLNRRGRKRG
jgi:hypothetical protein